jgi:hypothetical protein
MNFKKVTLINIGLCGFQMENTHHSGNARADVISWARGEGE